MPLYVLVWTPDPTPVGSGVQTTHSIAALLNLVAAQIIKSCHITIYLLHVVLYLVSLRDGFLELNLVHIQVS